ncbi:MAG TPA: class I SAM-dependent methyltransferase [Candidatus Saccharimonadia bacterium]|nr:class I SAM-dependent methyltransferase [Candidatus Saccharimonadia bacterium]
MKKNKQVRDASQYDDKNYNYEKYWIGRDYENACEEIAIRRLLKNKHFAVAVDVGGGYGRLCKIFQDYSDKVTLAEPSKKQLELAKHYLGKNTKVDLLQLQANDLKFEDKSIDLLTMIRVIHHLPNPTAEFSELHRVLKDDGVLILEVANYSHFLNRIKFILKHSKVPKEAIDIRSKKNRGSDVIPFVNHNPRTVMKQLAHAGFKVDKTLSVSNLRIQKLKTLIPLKILTFFEYLAQPVLALSFFGPSIFFRVRKAK